MKHEEMLLISNSVYKNLDKTGSVYTDDIMRDTKLTREKITRWLKLNDFWKEGNGTSRRWTKKAHLLNTGVAAV